MHVIYYFEIIEDVLIKFNIFIDITTVVVTDNTIIDKELR